MYMEIMAHWSLMLCAAALGIILGETYQKPYKIYKTVSRRPSSAVLRSSVRSQRPDEGSNESGASYVSTCTESVGAE